MTIRKWGQPDDVAHRQACASGEELRGGGVFRKNANAASLGGRGEQTKGRVFRGKRAPIIHALAHSVNSAGARTSRSHVGRTTSVRRHLFLEPPHRLKDGKCFGSAPPHTADGSSVSSEGDDDGRVGLGPR